MSWGRLGRQIKRKGGGDCGLQVERLESVLCHLSGACGPGVEVVQLDIFEKCWKFGKCSHRLFFVPHFRKALAKKSSFRILPGGKR